MSGDGKQLLLNKNILKGYESFDCEIEKNAQLREVDIPILNIQIAVIKEKDYDD
jgi:hypothetical protein